MICEGRPRTKRPRLGTSKSSCNNSRNPACLSSAEVFLATTWSWQARLLMKAAGSGPASAGIETARLRRSPEGNVATWQSTLPALTCLGVPAPTLWVKIPAPSNRRSMSLRPRRLRSMSSFAVAAIWSPRAARRGKAPRSAGPCWKAAEVARSLSTRRSTRRRRRLLPRQH